MTSRYSGSPGAPGSFVRSRTAIDFHAGGQCGEKFARGEWPVQTKLEHSDLFATLDQIVHRLVRGFGARSHDDDDALGVRSADVVGQMSIDAR